MFNLRTFTILGIVILGVMNCSPTAQIDIHALKSKYQLQLARYLVKDADVYNHVRILDEGIKIYESAAAWSADEYEFFVPWKDIERYKQLCENDTDLAHQIYNRYAVPKFPATWPRPKDYTEPTATTFEPTKEQPLKGLRIALDAGHIAGDIKTAKLEGKYIEMKYKGQKISFWEADLAWHTQSYLKRQLEKHGAIVFITRDYGKTAFGMDYDTWYARFDGMEEKPDKSRMFWRYFRHKDNDERVRIVNAFKPDLTLIMHYNVGGGRPWKRPIKNNYSMAFTGGAYMNGELFNKERRFNLLRLLLTDDIEESAKFSNDVLQYLKTDAGIPTHPLSSYQNNTIKTDYAGVYARNLALSGRIYGTLCYAEPLFQDNREEVVRLNERDYNFEGQMIPSRVVEIAQSYEKAILKYAETLK